MITENFKTLEFAKLFQKVRNIDFLLALISTNVDGVNGRVLKMVLFKHGKDVSSLLLINVFKVSFTKY